MNKKISPDLYKTQAEPHNLSEHIRGGWFKNDGYKMAYIEIKSPSYYKESIYEYKMLNPNISSSEEILPIAAEYKKDFLNRHPELVGKFMFYFCSYGTAEKSITLPF